MVKNKLLGGFFIEAIIYVVLILVKYWTGYASHALTLKGFYFLLFVVNITVFIILATAHDWAAGEVFAFIGFVLLAVISTMGLLAISNLYLDFIMIIFIILELIIYLIVSVDSEDNHKHLIRKDSKIFVASTNGKTVHKPDCVITRRIKHEDKKFFNQLGKAVENGYNYCKICKPQE